MVHPATFDPPSWGTMDVAGWTTYVEDGENVMVQRIVILAPNPGVYEVPAIEFGYNETTAFPPAETPDPQSPNAPMVLNTLRTPPFPVEVKPHTTPPWVSAGLPFLALLAIAGAFFVRRHARKPAPAPASNAGPALRGFEALAAAQKSRLDGDVHTFYKRLSEAAAGLPELEDRMRRQSDAVGYKGERPSPDQLDLDYRAVQRTLSEQKESQAE